MNTFQNNISLSKVLQKISQLDIKRIVNKYKLISEEDYVTLGEHIFLSLFEPVLFDPYILARYYILDYIGYYNIEEPKSENHKICLEALKEKFKSYIKVNIADPPNRIANQVTNYDYIYIDTISNPEGPSLFKRNIQERKIFFQQLHSNKKTLLDIIPLVDPKSYYYTTLLHDATVLEELPSFFKKLTQKRHEQRCWVSRILIRKELPCDLVPLICSFTVVGSKKYDYM